LRVVDLGAEGCAERMVSIVVYLPRLPGATLVLVEFGNSSHDESARYVQGLLLRRERCVVDLSAFGCADPRTGIVVPDRLRVLDGRPGIVRDGGYRSYYLLIHSYCYRDVRILPFGGIGDRLMTMRPPTVI